MSNLNYMLKLGNVYIAPRRSIIVHEPADFERIVNEDAGSKGCFTCGSTRKNYEITFKLELLGGGSLESAYVLRRQIDAELTSGCSGGPYGLADSEFLLTRRVRDETPVEYIVNSGYTRVVDPISQFQCEAILTIELTLGLSLPDRLIKPIKIWTTFPRPTRSMGINRFPYSLGGTIEPIEIALTFPGVTATLS